MTKYILLFLILSSPAMAHMSWEQIQEHNRNLTVYSEGYIFSSCYTYDRGYASEQKFNGDCEAM